MRINENSRLSDRTRLTTATAVVVANFFNVSIFQPLWIIKNGILREDEFTPNMLVSPGVSVFATEKFELMVLAERIQMRFHSKGYATAEDELKRVIGGIIRVLPHTPYTAMGFNLDFRISEPTNISFAKWNRQLFVAEASSRITDPTDDAARFGCYVSFNALGGRMKINMLPVHEQQVANTPSGITSSETDSVNAAFNFHTDVVQPASTDVMMQTLDRWDDTFDLCCELMRKIES